MKVLNHKETEFIMINIPEILVANGTGAFLVLFLLLYRIRIAQTNQFDEKAYNFMLIVTFIATINETLSFIIDARPGFIFHILQYISNTIASASSGIIGYCWCLFVEYHIHRNFKRIKKKSKILAIPLIIAMILLIINLCGTGIVITHEIIFNFSCLKIIYFFIYFNSVLVYTIIMKRYVTYPDWVEKFRSPGHTIKKTKQGYGLYSCTSKYVPGGKPKSVQTYLGKITPDGFIPKSVVSKHPVYVEYGLSHFIISSFKRDLIRSSFRATDDTVYLGVVQYIFGSCQDIFLSSCFLTYKNKESLCEYRDSISAVRIKTISNKIARLMESYFDAQEIAVLSQILKLAVVDITSDHIYYPTIPEEVVDIIERNGLHYEQ